MFGDNANIETQHTSCISRHWFPYHPKITHIQNIAQYHSIQIASYQSKQGMQGIHKESQLKLDRLQITDNGVQITDNGVQITDNAPKITDNEKQCFF